MGTADSRGGWAGGWGRSRCRWLAVAPALAAVAAASAAPPAPVPAGRIELVQPTGVAVDRAGNLYISDIATHRILKRDPHGALTVVAGTGEGGFSGDGGPAVKARLFAPHDVIADANGNILVADTYNQRIRRVDADGIITTIAGSGACGSDGDNGPALQASLNNPQGAALAPDGALFIADTYNHVVRCVDRSGTITTFAGTEAGLAGDGGPANRAQISLPTGVAVAADGTVTISDSGNNRIRRVNPEGIIDTLLGTGPGSGIAGAGFGGDGGPALKAKIFAAADVAVAPSGDVFVSDSGNHRIRLISRGIIRTVAGSGGPGAATESGAPPLLNPQKIALAEDGSLYVADRGNRRVVRLDPGGKFETVCGPAAKATAARPRGPASRGEAPPAAGGKR